MKAIRTRVSISAIEPGTDGVICPASDSDEYSQAEAQVVRHDFERDYRETWALGSAVKFHHRSLLTTE